MAVAVSIAAKQQRCSDGTMIAGMAYRVKYRKTCSSGRLVLKYLPIGIRGVHQKNHGGVYPAGVRCKSLNASICKSGFVKEEINHAAVAVEEIPISEQLSPALLTDAKSYNIQRCLMASG